MDDLYTALIWRSVWKHQLSPQCRDKWEGPEWSAYRELRDILKRKFVLNFLRWEIHWLTAHPTNPALVLALPTGADSSIDKSYHTWRHYTMRMLFSTHNFHSSVQRLKPLLRSDLSELLEARGQSPATIDDQLNHLAERMIKLDFCIQTTKFQIELAFDDQDTGKIFDFPLQDVEKHEGKLLMRNENPRPAPIGSNVDLIVEPMFKVYGKEAMFTSAAAFCLHNNEPAVKRYDFCSIALPSKVLLGLELAMDP